MPPSRSCTDRTLNATASRLAHAAPLIWSIGAAQRLAIRGEQWVRAKRRQSPDSGPAAHWHEGGRGPALLLLNGFAASGLLWPTTFIEQLERSYHVIRIDNRGTGWSRHASGPFTIATMAADAHDALRACGHDRATVVGISMGGVIAQELAIRHPECVDRLVLMATIPPPPAHVPPTDLAALMRLVFGPFNDDREFDPAYRMKVADALLAVASPHFEADDDLRHEIGSQVLRRVTTVKGALLQSRAIVAWHGPERLANVRAHTTVLSGQDDPIIPVANGRHIAALIPAATHVELPRTGHLVPWESGAAVLETLRP